MLTPGMRYVCVSVCLSVCLSVRLSQHFIATPLDRFQRNFTESILSKIWDDTFLIFWKFWFDDVITAFLMISFTALSRLQFLCSFPQIDKLGFSAYGIVWDCKPAFSVNSFNSIWPSKMAQMTVKMDICVKR